MSLCVESVSLCFRLVCPLIGYQCCILHPMSNFSPLILCLSCSNNPLPFFFSFCVCSSSVELQKANLEAQNSSTPGNNNPGSNSSGPANSNSPLASAIPLAQLLAKPGALNALSSLSALGGLSELLGGLSGSSPVQTTGVHRQNKTYQPRMRSPGGTGNENKGRSERSKFAPY